MFTITLISVFLSIFLGLEVKSDQHQNHGTIQENHLLCNHIHPFRKNILPKVSRSKRDLKSRVLSPPPSKTEVFDQLLQVTPFNTTMNFIVPGAKVHLAHNSEEGSLDHLAMQAFFGLFWAIAWLTTIAVPTLVTLKNFQPFGIGRSLNDPAHSFHLKWKLDERMSDVIGLNWDSCLQKTICQAHKNSDKYGVIGTAFQFLFPVPDKLRADKFAYHPETNVFNDAAVNGAIGQDCGRHYRCFFDVLDVLLYLKKYCFATLPLPH